MSGRIFRGENDMDVEDQSLSSIPAHVSIVRDGLLDFNRFLGLEATMLVLGDEESIENDVIPLCAYKTDGLKVSQRAREREFLESAKELAEGAQRLETGFVEDRGEWRALFRNIITIRNDDVHCSGSDQLSTIACAENEPWDTDSDSPRCSYTNPKPDLCIGFPVHDAEYHKFAGFRNDPSVQNFTVNTLFQLAIKGLRCTTVSSSLTHVAEMKRDCMELQTPLLCFPWCIIQLEGVEKAFEVKENDDSVSETSRKVSIAATGALAMIETLARFADVKQDGQHIPPVVTITSVGPSTTVWLAYSDIVDGQYRDHKMVSIWNGCISKIWDAVQFCRIVENVFFWSQHILRPKLSHYIDQWRFRKSTEAHQLHSQLEKDLETSVLVHRIEDRLSSLSILPNSNLPNLIQQAVILQEVMRSSLQKEPESKEVQHPNAETEIGISKKVSSHPKVNTSAVEASFDSETGEGRQGCYKSKEGEEGKEEDELNRGRGGSDVYDSAGSQVNSTFQLKPPGKNAVVLTELAIGGEKSASGDSIKTENKLGHRSSDAKSSTATNLTFPASPSKQSPVNKHFLISKSCPDFSTDEERDKDLSFHYPYKFKASDFEFDQRRLLSPSLKVISTCSGEPDASNVLASKGDPNNHSQNADASSGLQNPFIAKSFELSFRVKDWRCETSIKAQSGLVIPGMGPNYVPHKKATPSSGDCNTFEREQTILPGPPKTAKPGWQLADAPKPPFSKVRIPWKDGRYIVVRLPPVMPLSTSRNNLRLKSTNYEDW